MTIYEALEKLRAAENSGQGYHEVFHSIVEKRLAKLDPEFMEVLEKEFEDKIFNEGTQ